MELNLSGVLAALIVSAIIGAVVWVISALVFKQPDARNHGFIAFVVSVLLWLATELL